MELLARANELQAKGRPIIHMEVGEPDFPTPGPILASGKLALERGLTKYTPAEGLPALRELLSKHYQRQYGVVVDPARIFVTCGGSGALLLATALTLNHGEGLLMSDPGYPCNRHFLKSFGAEGQLVPVSAEVGFQLNLDLVKQYWKSNTRGVLLASPANPTGAIIQPDVLEAIINFVSKKQGHMIVDEIYHGLHYGDASVCTALEYSDEVIVINSFSKYFGMTGWRLGWMVVPESAIPLLEKLAQNLFICAPSIAQYAALSAFEPEAIAEMEVNRKKFKIRRDYLLVELRRLGFSIPVVLEGAFYIYATLPKGFESAEIFCSRMLEEFNVAITPGTDFGYFYADNTVRFSYAQSLDKLKQGVANLDRGLIHARQ
ncbi:MAG: aminotransferase class I/II-fold pyridoxal phosphate-dependent enzyme [Pseudomonadales bacterium]|nr:aminotransferase class I/II-fold pyridoxal phosphate-dependent enzyme [Pseudomonadales bacterium]